MRISLIRILALSFPHEHLAHPRRLRSLVLDVLASLDALGVDVSNMGPDHITYRAASLQSYELIKKRLDPFGQWQPEAEINGRPEVMAPKPGDTYPEGLEHIEFVSPVPLEDLIRRYPYVPFDTEGAAKAVNPELKLKFGRYGVKFHLCSVLEARASST